MDDAYRAADDAARARRNHGTRHRKPRDSRRSGSRPVLLVTGLAVLAAVLAVGAGLLGWAVNNNSDADAQRAAILSSAQRESAALTTLSNASSSSDYNAVLADSAGDLKEELTAGRSQLLKALGTNGASSVGTVMDGGVVSMKPGQATALVAVKALVKNKQTSKPESRTYYWQVSLVSSGGRWLVTSLEYM